MLIDVLSKEKGRNIILQLNIPMYPLGHKVSLTSSTGITKVFKARFELSENNL